jgi:hypothetical protein
MPYSLHRHPSTPNSPIRSIEVRTAIDRQVLTLEYRLEGDIDALELPPPVPPSHTDGLWQSTCCEAFLQAPDISPGYYELNFSPSGAWAAYCFDAYRQGMAALAMNSPPAIHWYRAGQRLVLAATVDLEGLDTLHMPPASPALNVGAAWHLGVSAVIKERQSGISYWALAHPGEKPDFHHADSFISRLF